MSSTALPGHTEQPQEILCASCGRFVGALPRCPHCGARVAARLSVRFFRYAALFLGVVGLLLLYLMARAREVPQIQIGHIRPTMNFAFVRVAGEVTGEPRVTYEGGHVRSVRFNVSDDTGEIPILAFRTKGQELVDRDKIPRSGDRVEVTGSLSVSADNLAIWLQAPDQMKLERAEVPPVRLADVSEQHVQHTVRLEATVVRLTPPREGSRAPWTLHLRDESGEADVSIWSSVIEEFTDRAALQMGARVRLRAAVGSYREHIQLTLPSARDIELAAAPPVAPPAATAPVAAPPAEPAAALLPIRDLHAGLDGRWVQVQGIIESVTPPERERAPHRLVLSDGTGRITVVYWDSVAGRLAGDRQPRPGQSVRVRGHVGLHQDEVQLKVERADQISPAG
jgi:DNA/RNA endonuclease YhcR with UshA esterase domain